jgi:hypothetical protein
MNLNPQRKQGTHDFVCLPSGKTFVKRIRIIENASSG